MKKEITNVELKKFLKGSIQSPILSSLFSQNVPLICGDRTGLLLKILNRPKINLVCLRSHSFRGIPSECKGLRAIIWRLLLGYLPLETGRWELFLQEKSKEYKSLYSKFTMPSVPKAIIKKIRPLTEQEELAKEIKTDLKRTKRDMLFFSELIPNAKITTNSTLHENMGLDNKIIEESKIKENKSETINNEDQETDDFIYDDKETHRLVMSRMLYIYAKQNPDLGYVQGMNELLAVLYYCFFNDTVPELQEFHESDTYFCFIKLMEELKDVYSKSDPGKPFAGIAKIVKTVEGILKRVDEEYWEFFTETKTDLQLFTLRWIMLLFAQDIEIVKVMRLWDSVFADAERFLFFYYVIAEVIEEAKKNVMGSEFYEYVKILQATPRTLDLIETLKKAGNMCAKDTKKDCYIGEHYY